MFYRISSSFTPAEPWQLHHSNHGDSLASFCQAIYIRLFSHGLVSHASRRSASLNCLTSDQTDGFRVDYFSLPLDLDWLNEFHSLSDRI